MLRALVDVVFAGMYEFNLVLLLLQQMCVFLVIAWLMSKTRLFIPLMQVTVRLPHKLLCYVTFSIFCILGTYFGLHIEDSIANTRAIGAVMGIALGAAVGAVVERRHRGEARPLTKYEKRGRRVVIGVGIVALVPLVAAAALGVVALLLR